MVESVLGCKCKFGKSDLKPTPKLALNQNDFDLVAL